MILACLGDRPGEVRIYIAEGQELNGPTHFIAHENAISCMALNTDGSRLATASERGTLVRVFLIQIMDRNYMNIEEDLKQPKYLVLLSIKTQQLYVYHLILELFIFII